MRFSLSRNFAHSFHFRAGGNGIRTHDTISLYVDLANRWLKTLCRTSKLLIGLEISKIETFITKHGGPGPWPTPKLWQHGPHFQFFLLWIRKRTVGSTIWTVGEPCPHRVLSFPRVRWRQTWPHTGDPTWVLSWLLDLHYCAPAGQSVKASFLSPYLESLGSTFRNGANFAIVGSSTLPKFVPFALNVQVMQFLRFKARSLQLAAAGKTLKGINLFTETLHITELNDLSRLFWQLIVRFLKKLFARIVHANSFFEIQTV